MQAKLRRALSVLAVLTMLCTLLPLSAMSVAAEATIANADFETGSVGSLPTGWSAYDATKQSQVSNTDAHSGSQSAILAWRNQRFVLYQDVTVEPNYTYTVSFWYRSLRTSSSQGTVVNYTFGAYNTSSKGNVVGAGGTYIDATATEVTTDYHKGSWTQMTYTFDSGSNTTVRLGFAGASSSSTFTADQGHILVDDLSISGVPAAGGEEQGEAVYTNDFENGIGGWTASTGSNGNGTAEIVGPADLPVANANVGNNVYKFTSVYYNFTSDSAGFSVERNTDYVFTYDILSGSAGYPIKTIVGINSWFSTQVIVSTATPSATQWQTVSVKFNSGNNTKLYLGWQTGWDAGTYYIDNISVTKVIESEEEEDENLVLNGSFEDGEANWTLKNCTHSIVTDAQEGEKALQISAITGQYAEAALSNVISTTPGNIYTIKWWSKRISNDTGAFNLYVNGSHTKVSGQNWMNKAASAGWVEHEYVVKANDDCQSIQLKFSTEVSGGNSGTILIDNVQVYEQKQPSFDGWLYNGDFEVGEATHWEIHQSTAVSRDAKYSGKYGLNLIGDGSYGGLANQTITTEVGKIYLVSMWIKANSNGTNFKVADANGEKLAYTWFNKTEWTYQEFEFTATSTSTLLNFSGGGNGIAEDIYVDDIKVVELKDPSFDGYVYNGDFEAGSLVKWSSYQQTALSSNAAYSGNYGAHIYGDANWGGLLNQTITVEAGKTYKISFWYRGWSNGV
ncbi:MAG: carbohydrate binding domain-containing protein, partial [Clostridia bacterium]|nr:carbohydrate binding domain-containing protein [Clostridia bacterium]